MKKIYIKTTEACNLKCKHCYIGDNRQKTAFFNEDQTISWLLKYKKIHNEDLYISFHGGEPFLAPLNKLEKVCKTLTDCKFDATSNLLLVNEDIIKFIKQYFKDDNGAPFIKTSWDWKIRFNLNQERLWINNVKQLLNNGINVKVNICLTKLLIKDWKPLDLINYIYNLGIKEIHFERLSYNTTEDKSLIPNYDDQDKWILDFYLVNNKLIVDNFLELQYAADGIFIDCRKRQCMNNVVTINADGTIGGCPNTSIKDWYTTIYKEPDISLCSKHCELIDKEKKRMPQCYYCDLYQICNGDCCQLTWIDGKCPAFKRLMRKIKNDVDMERQKKISLSYL